MYCVWVSIDPVRRKIDFYPRAIASRIEKKYKERNVNESSCCILGKDFFNSTIHFHHSGSCYQTTPGMSMGRAGFKQPGYRSVKRINISQGDEYIEVFSKKVQGEWRLALNQIDSDIKFNEPIDKNSIISTDLIENINNEYENWNPEDLNINDSDNLQDTRIVWQWCRGVPEKQGNLMLLSDKWWSPYLYPQNKIIEEGFKNNNSEIKITIPFDNSERIIEINQSSCFGYQKDEENNKIRLIRRKIVTILELQEMIKNINNIDPSINILQDIDDDEIPKEFYCCISQDIMNDPVKTCDGQTYDRINILQWFEINNTSPLTGLSLPTKDLVSNVELKEMIEEYFKNKHN